MSFPARLVVLLVALLLALAVPAAAQAPARTAPPAASTPSDAEFAQRSAGWGRDLDRAAQALRAYRLGDDDIQRLRDQVLAVREQAVAVRNAAQAEATPLKRLVEALGPAPAAEAPEATEVASQRRELAAQLAHAEGQGKQAELVAARAEQVLGDITNQRFRRFADRLTERGPSPANPATWWAGADELAGITGAYGIAAEDNWRRVLGSSALDKAVVAGGILLALAFGWPMRWWLLRRFGPDRTTSQPSYPRRVAAAIAVGAARGVLPAIAILALVMSFFSKEEDLLTGSLANLVLGLAAGGILYLVLSGLSRAALAPDAPGWRILDFSDSGAAALARRFDRLIALVALQVFYDLATQRFSAIDNLSVLVAFTLALLIALAVAHALDPRQWVSDASPAAVADGSIADATLDTSSPWATIRLGAIAVALAAPIVALAGYGTLARFLYVNLCETALVLGLALLVRVLVREALPALLQRDTGLAASLRHRLLLGPQAMRLSQFWLTVLFDVLLWLMATLVVLSFWGMSWGEMGRVGLTLLEGVRIGGYTFSLADFLAAGLLFGIVVAGTRFVQRMLEDRIFPRTKLDPGVRNSLKAGIGYVGVVIASAMAISTLGLNLSNLALIAGALSVGIGFGLQNIVNNFVSGLLLLIERPIKVGDRVVVGDKEGTVKRISVRSTEIETFRRASVIIPNSEFLTNAVTNWTHKDRQARIDITLGLDYDVDARQVADILTGCAKANPRVSARPAPRTLLTGFANDALQFELNAFIEDVSLIREIDSELRMAVLEALRAAGIKLPSKDHTISLKEIDRLATLVGAEEPALPQPGRTALAAPGKAATGD